MLAQVGTKKRRQLPFEFGRVVINSYSEKADLAPVVFEHWLHWTKFTRRLCHVDISFAMKADGTDMKVADNMKGYYCRTWAVLGHEIDWEEAERRGYQAGRFPRGSLDQARAPESVRGLFSGSKSVPDR